MSDLSDHEDVDVHIESSDCKCFYLFTHSSNHDSNSPIFYLSKPPTFDYPLVNEVETPQAIKELQREIMVMLGSHNLKG